MDCSNSSSDIKSTFCLKVEVAEFRTLLLHLFLYFQFFTSYFSSSVGTVTHCVVKRTAKNHGKPHQVWRLDGINRGSRTHLQDDVLWFTDAVTVSQVTSALGPDVGSTSDCLKVDRTLLLGRHGPDVWYKPELERR